MIRVRLVLDVVLVLVVAGIALLVLGARFLVDAATQIAQAAGLSDLVIGLTVVSIGTSLSEVATALIAALRGERELAIGNGVGSNVFNVGAVLGITALIAPDGVPVEAAAIRFDLPMVVVALALARGGLHRGQHRPLEAAAFLAYYAAYITYLLLDAAEHDALPVLSSVLLWFLAPMTALILAVLSAYDPHQTQGTHLSQPVVIPSCSLPEMLRPRHWRFPTIYPVPVATTSGPPTQPQIRQT